VIPGILLCLVIALAAFGLGHLVPIVGGPVFGIVAGMLVALPRPPAARFLPGIRFASKQLLQLSIILLGANLQLGEVIGTKSATQKASALAIYMPRDRARVRTACGN